MHTNFTISSRRDALSAVPGTDANSSRRQGLASSLVPLAYPKRKLTAKLNTYSQYHMREPGKKRSQHLALRGDKTHGVVAGACCFSACVAANTKKERRSFVGGFRKKPRPVKTSALPSEVSSARQTSTPHYNSTRQDMEVYALSPPPPKRPLATNKHHSTSKARASERAASRQPCQ